MMPEMVLHSSNRSGLALNWGVFLGTVRAMVLRWASNTILLVRSPIYPLLSLIAFKIVYDISGQTTIDQAKVMGFLVTGVLAVQAWQATVWGAGSALQNEMWSGTIGSILMAPGSSTAVILGHTIGNFVFTLPSILIAFVAGQLLGAEYNLAHPIAMLVALAAVYISCICVGLCFSGLFILSRQANAFANFLQEPIHLLGGFYVSRSLFPDWVHRVSDVIPLAHAVDALRAAALDGASLSTIADELLATAVTSAVFIAVGVWSLARPDRAVRRSGTLDLL
jgi:ABC-type polysaccharide/polyol phosphate export permease